MKRIIKSVSRVLWRMSSPVRRPLMVRYDAHVSKVIAGTVNARMMPTIAEALADSSARLERIERTLDRADQAAASMAEEMDLVLNGLTREVFRLQSRVERLQRSLGEAGRLAHGGLTILDGSEEDVPSRRAAAPADRARVG